MICEKCGNEMIVAVRNGIETEYCFECYQQKQIEIASIISPKPENPQFPKRELPIVRIKSKPWTPAPVAKAIGGSPSVINDPNSGGMFDPTAEKSLGRYHYGDRYYSKRVSDVDKSACKNNPLYYQIPAGEIAELPEHKPVDGVNYGLELLEESFSFLDADGIQRYNTKWTFRLNKSERVERYGGE